MTPLDPPLQRMDSRLTAEGLDSAPKSPGKILKTQRPGPLLRDSHLIGLGPCPDTGMLKSSPCVYNVQLELRTTSLGRKKLVQVTKF